MSEVLSSGATALRKAKKDPAFMRYFVRASAEYQTEYMTYLATDIQILNRETIVARFKRIGH